MENAPVATAKAQHAETARQSGVIEEWPWQGTDRDRFAGYRPVNGKVPCMMEQGRQRAAKNKRYGQSVP
jgi:hypothetical protein